MPGCTISAESTAALAAKQGGFGSFWFILFVSDRFASSEVVD
jgi:hypothetical protein